jgi:hypothetical protein
MDYANLLQERGPESSKRIVQLHTAPCGFAVQKAAPGAGVTVWDAQRKPETHRVDPESGSTLRPLQIFSVKLLGQLVNFGPTLSCVNWIQCSDLTPIFIGMHRNAPQSPMEEGARVHHSYGSYAPSTYGSYEPRRENPSTDWIYLAGVPRPPRARQAGVAGVQLQGLHLQPLVGGPPRCPPGSRPYGWDARPHMIV